MGLQRGLPLLGMFGVLPARPMGRNVALSRLAECLIPAPLLSLAPLQGSLVPFRDGVQTVPQLPPRISRQLPGLRQRYSYPPVGIGSAQTHLTGLAVAREAQQPAFGITGRDLQIKPSAVP